MKSQVQPTHESLRHLLKSPVSPLAVAAFVVVATGIISALARVEIASPFTSRQIAVQVSFYDETGKVVNPNPAQLLPLALQRRLGYQAEIYRPEPQLLQTTLQGVLAWLSLWLGMGLTFWIFNRSLTTSQWWRIGSIAGWLLIWRLLQALSVSCWLWLPNWRSDLVVALLDLVQGHPVSANLLWAVLWRGAVWLLTGIATLIHLLIILRRGFSFPYPKAFAALIAVYLLARLIYALSIGQFWQ